MWLYLGSWTKEQHCMFSTFRIKNYFVSKGMPQSESGKMKVRFSDHRLSHKKNVINNNTK